ncbi:MAG TPA: ABC-2 transporter permease [Clostridia bacterium]|nr:ABC-2 transporter permease [Clostridia bacterium]
MKQLIIKDIRLLGFVNLIVIIVAIIGGYIGATFVESLKANFAYGFSMIVSLFLINNMISAKESKTKSDPLMISMPVNKFDIIKARYFTMIIYVSGILGTMYIVSHLSKIIFGHINGNPLDLIGISIISSIMIIFLSFHIPFQYYSLQSAQLFSVFLYLLIMLAPNIINRLNIDISSLSFIETILTMDFAIIGSILLVVALVFYFISSLVSKGIYEAKEF